MDFRTIRLLWDYTRWADGRTCEAVSKLSPEQYTKDLASSHKSVRDTLVHLASAQWIWLSRWKGTSPPAMWPAQEYPTFADLKARWDPLQQEYEQFVAGLSAPSLRREIAYKNLKGEPKKYPLGHMLLHAFNHSTYHRGQVTTLLRQLSAQPNSTDLVAFVDLRLQPVKTS
jgi:uncharacterized damage-inducible protein DinB